MFQRIGVPLDGSACAEQALPIAARLARASTGTVVLLRVVNPPCDLAPYYPSDPEVVQAMVHDEKVAAHHYLESVTHMNLLADVRTETAVLCGQPAVRIPAEVEAARIDLLVMCSRNSSDAKRWLSGSLAEQIISGAPVPVLVLRDESKLRLMSASKASEPFRALVPLDGSDYAQAALAPAAQLVAALSAPAPGALHLARIVVLPDARGNGESERSAILQQAWGSLERIVEDLRHGLLAPRVRELHPSLAWSVTIDDDIASGISRLAEDGEGSAVPEGVDRADLIAMATRGLGESQRCGAGSVTARVLHTTRLPLLIVPPHGMEHRGHLVQDGAICA
jgi:nucleotide-binding universal stress UspA family protein